MNNTTRMHYFLQKMLKKNDDTGVSENFRKLGNHDFEKNALRIYRRLSLIDISEKSVSSNSTLGTTLTWGITRAAHRPCFHYRRLFVKDVLAVPSQPKSDSEQVNPDDTRLKIGHSTQSNKSSNWIKKLGSRSTSKTDLTSSTRSLPGPNAEETVEYRNEYRRRIVPPEPMTLKRASNSGEVPKIERIRREFEMGFLSPKNQESGGTKKSGHFVKKIVAAFEEKYKSNNDVKVETKKSSIESVSSDDSSFEDENTVEEMMEESVSILCGDTYVIESLESRLSRYLDSYIAASSTHIEEPRSDEEIGTEPGKCCYEMNEESRQSSRNPSPKVDETTRRGSDTMSFARETNDGQSLPVTSSGKLARRDSSIRREREPKIVGAYLKEPIKIDDRSIDWIPITGKKLPRKRSFKRLLAILTGKKSTLKSSKLYSTETKHREETTKDILQDSGYDEKSVSSSSLVSLVSFNDLLSSQQKDQDSANLLNDRRGFNMTTFRQKSAHSVEHDDDNDDDRSEDFSSISGDVSDTLSVSSKKLFLQEVSRSELRLSLGPAFPKAPSEKSIGSLDSRVARSSTGNNTENDWTMMDESGPLVPPLPKHPFVSLKKKTIDDNNDDDNYYTHVLPKQTDNGNDIKFCELEKIEFRRDFQSWKFPTEEITYDTPRRYLSKSEPILVSIGKNRLNDNLPIKNVYDVPKPKIPPRPRSSNYEDELSLKRRNETSSIYAESLPGEFYGLTSNREPIYATIKPRNTRIKPNRELLGSLGYPSFKVQQRG